MNKFGSLEGFGGVDNVLGGDAVTVEESVRGTGTGDFVDIEALDNDVGLVGEGSGDLERQY